MSRSDEPFDPKVLDAGPRAGVFSETAANMPLRDYFAGQALMALMSSPSWVAGLDSVTPRNEFKAAVAAHTYLMADAMLKARNET